MKLSEIIDGVNGFFSIVFQNAFKIFLTLYSVSLFFPLTPALSAALDFPRLQVFFDDERTQFVIEKFGLEPLIPFFTLFLIIGVIILHGRVVNFCLQYVPPQFSFSPLSAAASLGFGARDQLQSCLSIIHINEMATDHRSPEEFLSSIIVSIENSENPRVIDAAKRNFKRLGSAHLLFLYLLLNVTGLLTTFVWDSRFLDIDYSGLFTFCAILFITGSYLCFRFVTSTRDLYYLGLSNFFGSIYNDSKLDRIVRDEKLSKQKEMIANSIAGARWWRLMTGYFFADKVLDYLYDTKERRAGVEIRRSDV